MALKMLDMSQGRPHPREMGHKWDEPYDCPNILPGQCRRVGETQPEPRDLPEFRNWTWEPGKPRHLELTENTGEERTAKQSSRDLEKVPLGYSAWEWSAPHVRRLRGAGQELPQGQRECLFPAAGVENLLTYGPPAGGLWKVLPQ